jgi:hypothetical protein
VLLLNSLNGEHPIQIPAVAINTHSKKETQQQVTSIGTQYEVEGYKSMTRAQRILQHICETKQKKQPSVIKNLLQPIPAVALGVLGGHVLSSVARKYLKRPVEAQEFPSGLETSLLPPS